MYVVTGVLIADEQKDEEGRPHTQAERDRQEKQETHETTGDTGDKD